MQISTWTPFVGQNSRTSSHQTHSSMQFDPTPQMGYYHLQQKGFDEQSARLRNPHIFSQAISSSANLQSNQTPQMWSGGSQSHLPYISPASGRHPPNIVPYTSFQVGPLTVNHDPSVISTTIQRNYTDLHSMQNGSCTAPHCSVLSVPSTANRVSENTYCMHDSNPWQHPGQNHRVENTCQPAAQSQQAVFTAQLNLAAQTINMNQGQMSVVGQHDERLRSVAQFPDASRMLGDSLLPSQVRPSSSQTGPSQVKNALWQTLSHRKSAGYIVLKHSSSRSPSKPYRTRLNSAIPDQSIRRLNQVSPTLTQDKIQSQTTPIFGHKSKTNFATIQGSTQSQDLQTNTISGLAMNSQDITSFSTSTSQTSSSSKYLNNHLLLRLLLQKDDHQLNDLIFSSNSFGSQSAKSKSGSQQSTHGTTAGHITTEENYTQGKARQGKKYKEHAKETGISSGTKIGSGHHLVELQKSSQKETTNWEKRNEQVQSCIEPADSLKLRMVQQVNKIVAVVSPISQQASSHGQQNNVITSTHDSLPLKTDTFKNFLEYCENMDKEKNVPNVSFKLIEALHQVPSSAGSSPRLGSTIDTSTDISKMPTSENNPTTGSQSCDISRCKNGPVSTTQISNKCQDAVHIVGSASKGSVEQNDDQEVKSFENTTFDLSTVPVIEYTLKELKDLVTVLDIKPTERDKLTKTDVVKSIIDLYYDGNKQNLVKLLASNDLFKISSELCVKKMNAVVLLYQEPKHLKMLENCSQMLINETTLPSEVFRSSWLNVDGQPADIENVLAEPVSDYNLTGCKKVAQSVSESVVNVVDSLAQIGRDHAEDLGVHTHKDIPKTTTDGPEDTFHSDPVHSTAIFAKTDCKADMMILENGCVSKTPSELSRMQFNQHLDEVDMVKVNKRAFTEPSIPSNSDKCGTNNSDVFEKEDTSDETDSTNDLPDFILLSSEEAKKIFSECSEFNQKREPHQICQEERMDLVTHCVKKLSDSVKENPLDNFKFTCPHVTSLASGNDFFCPSCWNETPLLDFDQDETLLTPKKGELNTVYHRQTCSPQSGKPVEYPSVPACLESNSIIKSIISTPKSDGSDVMKDPQPGDQTQSCSPPPALEPYHGIAGTKNNNITKPTAEDLQKIVFSSWTKAENLKKDASDSPSRTKLLTGMVSPSRNLSCNNVKSSNTDVVPEASDILFSPDIVIKNTSTPKQHPNDHRSKSTCRDEGRESFTIPIKKTCLDQLSTKTKVTPQMPNGSGTPYCKAAIPHKQKRLIIKEKGHVGKSDETKKVRLELYGSNSSNSGAHDEKKSPSTPIYLTISHSPNTGKSYTDEPSAKQKIYSQWRTTFIHPQKSSSSYKKSHKNMEDQLKLKIQMLKKSSERQHHGYFTEAIKKAQTS